MAELHSLDLEENLAMGRSSRADTKFDTTVGHLEDIIMEDEFQTMLNSFMEKHVHHFEDTEENKLIYTEIFKEYEKTVEKYIEDELKKRMPSFSMEDFMKLIQHRSDQIGPDIVEMLLSFTDFLAFKQMFLDYKASKEGTALDFSDLMTVVSLSVQRHDTDDVQDMQVDPDSPRDAPKKGNPGQYS
ncbi:ADP-ribosylation factor-like protein 2-binding protein [Actinia tenebrosa]|uniref:ADP-ribosylation factor-like protein 2-binding protein n=1 Tax=Actinia tenebrosa TaxID=6105 RepID=A0A6P8H9U3_ACTTE|nr:ADP-ribosylation factor-like protein 2-binding protein [Actinia tenebrosa]